jgi:hypothetical protein
VELFTLIRLFLSSHTAVIAENLFLRKQLGLFKNVRSSLDVPL